MAVILIVSLLYIFTHPTEIMIIWGVYTIHAHVHVHVHVVVDVVGFNYGTPARARARQGGRQRIYTLRTYFRLQRRPTLGSVGSKS
jgi:hypothetical protein